MEREPIEEYKYKDKLELKAFNDVHKVCCPTCSQEATADNLNIHSHIAKCTQCDAIFSFGNQVEQLSQQHKIKQEFLQPEGVEISHFKDEMDIAVAQPWTNIEVIAIMFFPIMIFFISILFVKYAPATDFYKVQLVILWLTSLVGFSSYFYLRKDHKLFIHIDSHNLHIEKRPRKFSKDQQYVLDDIDQVYVKDAYSSGGAKGFSLAMIINSVNGQKHVELIKYLDTRSKAKYIEQEIESYIGITDRRVPDEAS